MANETSTEEIVDTHAHIFRADLPMVASGLHFPKRHFEAAAYLAILDAHGVRHAAIAAPSFLGTYNDYTIAALRQQPRLRGTAIVEPDTSPYLLRAMGADGIVGVRLSLRGARQLPDLAGSEYQRLFYRLADLDWHVHLHIEGERLPAVLPVLTASPVKLVVDHFGRPEPSRAENSEGFNALLKAFETGRTWVKLSGGFRIGCDPLPLARRLLETGGPDRLLWGSDCPFTDFETKVTYQSTIDAFRQWVPNREDRRRIMSSAKTLYHFD